MEGSVNIVKDDVWGTGKSLRTSDRARFLQRHACLKGRP